MRDGEGKPAASESIANDAYMRDREHLKQVIKETDPQQVYSELVAAKQQFNRKHAKEDHEVLEFNAVTGNDGSAKVQDITVVRQVKDSKTGQINYREDKVYSADEKSGSNKSQIADNLNKHKQQVQKAVDDAG